MRFTKSVWWSGWKFAASAPCATSPSAGSSQILRGGPRGPRTPWRCDRRGTSLLRDRQALTHLRTALKNTTLLGQAGGRTSPKYTTTASVHQSPDFSCIDGGREGKRDFPSGTELMCRILGHNVACSKINWCLVDSKQTNIQTRIVVQNMRSELTLCNMCEFTEVLL